MPAPWGTIQVYLNLAVSDCAFCAFFSRFARRMPGLRSPSLGGVTPSLVGPEGKFSSSLSLGCLSLRRRCDAEGCCGILPNSFRHTAKSYELIDPDGQPPVRAERKTFFLEPRQPHQPARTDAVVQQAPRIAAGAPANPSLAGRLQAPATCAYLCAGTPWRQFPRCSGVPGHGQAPTLRVRLLRGPEPCKNRAGRFSARTRGGF